jgi:hypothetical protein
MKHQHKTVQRSKEQGSVLLVTMVFLLLFAIVATTVFRGSQTSVQAVGNMQWRTEAINASNEVVANILSDNVFITNALTHGMKSTASPNGKFSTDVNGDGTPDISVNIDSIVCSYFAEVKQEDLDPDNPADLACMNSGNMPAATFCSEVQFSVLLTATDPVSAASVQIEQGVGVRVSSVELCKF